MHRRNNPVTTAAIAVATLFLGLPVAITAIVYEQVYVPNVILGSKLINSGLGRTTTVYFNLFTSPNDVVTAAACISIIFSFLAMTGLILIRHFTKHNVWGWLVFLPALSNFLAQIGCCFAAFIFVNEYPISISPNQIQFIDGHYNTNGRLFSKESWACTVKILYPEQEGYWAVKACSDFQIGRIMTIPLIACGFGILGIGYWQIHLKGGFGWLFGHLDKISDSHGPKGEYIDLHG